MCVKFAKMSFCDEFIGYFSCFLFYGFDHCSYDLGSKERKMFYIDALVATHVCFVSVRFPCIHDLQLDGFYPCFEMSSLMLHTFSIV
jgi:hypothetical protein